MESWEITNDKIAVFVTDNAANIVKAIQLYHRVENKGFKHLGCFAHTIHLIVFEDGIKEATGLNELLTKVKDIVSFFKRSVTASDILKKKTPLKLIQSVPTRWNSTFFMLERFLKISEFINEVIFYLNANGKEAPSMIDPSEMTILREVAEILQPWSDLTSELSAEKNVTASKIIPFIFCINKFIEKFKTTTQIGSNLLKCFKDSAHIRLNKSEQNHMLAILTILDPRFKTDNFGSALNVAKAISHIKTEMTRLLAEDLKSINTTASESVEVAKTKTSRRSAI